MQGFLDLALYVAIFCFWAYGVAICWGAHELFWAVVCFSFFPAGVIVGAFSFFF